MCGGCSVSDWGGEYCFLRHLSEEQAFATFAQAEPFLDQPDNVIYSFGPEDGTLSQDVIDKADALVYVPTNGCMNLAAAVNVVLYDRLAQSDLSLVGDQKAEILIIKSN